MYDYYILGKYYRVYLIDWLYFLDNAKNAIYKKKIKIFKVVTCFNGNYMIHTALF